MLTRIDMGARPGVIAARDHRRAIRERQPSVAYRHLLSLFAMDAVSLYRESKKALPSLRSSLPQRRMILLHRQVGVDHQIERLLRGVVDVDAAAAYFLERAADRFL